MQHKLSQQQAYSLEQIGIWLKRKDQPYLTLGGFAGTGKTYLLTALRQLLKDNRPELSVAFVAYTGKATLVLRNYLKSQKANQPGDTISTLHSLLYYSESKSDGSVSWRKREKLKADIVIVDEASMVNEEIWQDLLSHNKPVLAVGDHGQLPPINSSFNLMADPELRLEQIWRQAAGSPIIEMATLARTTGVIPPGNYGPGAEKFSNLDGTSGDFVESFLQNHSPDTMVLCGYNHTRQKLNNQMRSLKGFETAEPSRGDVVVCLRNSRESGLANGQLGIIETVANVKDDPEGIWWHIEATFDGIHFDGWVPREQFGAATTIARLPKHPKDQIIGLFDFGYGLTVHKAQGSQAKKVLLFEQRFSKMSDDEWRRWLYTAVTRAENELYIIGN